MRTTALAAIIIGAGDPPILTLIAALLIQIVARYFAIEGESYRLKEANERAQKKGRQRRGGKA